MISSKALRSGTTEWVYQRISNIAICLWGVIFISLILTLDTASYSEWKEVFSPVWFKVYSSITLVMVCINSILAGWQIGTDYIKPRLINIIYTIVIVLGSLAYSILGMSILWGL
ncbi:succinate dehydrogenase, hydrophobic membrane anchor protein [Marinomonas algarum]|uniref:Succinate dehydrogenase hydrophobic membrane anchor subunit n=1 Tax=Marinomonas algarum TaxID=2883105 RepID=A0A9X1LC69_9GAMM|nr:succinate dehydrogenase, hydrophobic membrane anchor protein [Marinomonas algarum]MCB5161684.1 succinate dehydrogenase, hydrophobic membrane anchor protein [Marinomonas algarum]